MMIRVNGVEIALDDPMDLQTFLEREGYSLGRVAVEKNGEIVPKASYSTEMLAADDRLEIVSFVGGG